MDNHFMNITVCDQTTKRSRAFSLLFNSRLSQLRQLIQKQWEIKDFKFVNNDNAISNKIIQKHAPVEMYLKPYNTITISTQRQQPKKQSKIIQKQSKKQQPAVRSNVSSRYDPQLKQNNTESTQQIIKQKHFRWTKQNIEYCSFKYGIQLSEDGQGLDHDYTKINMDDFTQYDWRNIEWLSLYRCQIDDKAWRLFVQKATLFPKLKILGISINLSLSKEQNQLSTVKQGDLQAFKSLRLVQFGTISGANPLTEQSKEYLRKFRDQNPHVKIKFKS